MAVNYSFLPFAFHISISHCKCCFNVFVTSWFEHLILHGRTREEINRAVSVLYRTVVAKILYIAIAKRLHTSTHRFGLQISRTVLTYLPNLSRFFKLIYSQ